MDAATDRSRASRPPERESGTEPSALALWYASLALWVILSLADAVDYYAGWRFAGVPGSYGRALAAAFPGWMLWAFLSPLIFLAARRIRLSWPPAPGPLLTHFALSVLIGLIHTTVHASAGWYFGVRPSTLSLRDYYSSSLFDWMPINLLMYWAVVGAFYGLDYYRRYQRAQLEAAELSQRLTEARLGALQSQLHPHFLFNTLNAAVALVRTGDGKTATEVLTQLGDILRHLLYGNTAPEVSLGEELTLLNRYLAIEQLRFSNRLRVALDVPDALRTAMVPNLLLQPLVENAIRHGLNQLDGIGQLTISAHQDHDRLVLRVQNDGPSLPDTSSPQPTGLGLSNSRARLAHLYGADATLTLTNAPHGVLATVVLPFRLTPAPAVLQ